MCIVCKILGNELIDEVYFYMKSTPVSFAALKGHRRIARIDELIGEKKSDHFIADKVDRCKKTIARRRKFLLKKSKTKRPPKK